jgi:hypothetical protein
MKNEQNNRPATKTAAEKERRRVLRRIEEVALRMAASGSRKISIKFLIEGARASGLKVNNTDSATIARFLIRKHKQLRGLIETRTRWGTGKARELPAEVTSKAPANDNSRELRRRLAVALAASIALREAARAALEELSPSTVKEAA